MALNVVGLESDLAELFADPPATIALCAQAWASAMQAYASGIIPASVTVTAAAATLQSSLVSAFGSQGGAAALMETAFAAFAVTVGGGMAGFVATPPPAPVGFATLGSAQPDTHSGAAEDWAQAIHSWMITGSATPTIGGPPVLWS
jgi:hypothetical protein